MLLKIVVRRSKKVDLDRFATIIQSFDNVMSYGESVLHRSEKRTYDNADRIKKLENEVAEIKKTLSEIRAHEEKAPKYGFSCKMLGKSHGFRLQICGKIQKDCAG